MSVSSKAASFPRPATGAPVLEGAPHRRIRREHRQAEFARLLRGALDGAGVTITQMSEAVGFSRQRGSKCVDPNSQTTLPCSDLPAIPSSVAIPLLRSLAASHGWVVSELPKVAANDTDDFKQFGSLVTDVLCVLQHHADALAEGHTAAADADLMLGFIDDAIGRLMAVRGRYELAHTERIVPLRRA